MIPISAPLTQYNDNAGQPLNLGYLYFGQVNDNPETAPITVYWDIEGTQPAAQPIRTIGGYATRNGTPANIFVATQYSLTVKSSRGVVIFYGKDSRTFDVSSIINSSVYTTLASGDGTKIIGYQYNTIGAKKRTVYSKLSDTVSVKDYGAIGDGTGITPADQGIDIMSESWNCYPIGSAYYDPDYTPDVSITPSTKAFSNTDSWDTIGIQLALWYNRFVELPYGRYLLTRPLQRVRNMEGLFCGQGALHSVITYKSFVDFGTRPAAGNALLHYYRVAGGPPSYIRDFALESFGGATLGTGLFMQNCNQIHIDDMWITAFQDGVFQSDQCTDGPFITAVTFEYCFAAIRSNDSVLFNVNHCDFWQTAGGGLTYNGVIASAGVNLPGDVNIHNCNFVGYRGYAVQADGAANISGCYITRHIFDVPISVGNYSQVCNNYFEGAWSFGAIAVNDRCVVTGNTIRPDTTNVHADIQINGTRNMVTGNYIAKTNTDSYTDNYAIYVASGSLNFIHGNYLDGGSRAVVQAGATDMVINNVQNGIFIDSPVFNWTVVDASGASLTITQNTQAISSQKGNSCTVNFDITFPSTVSTNSVTLTGFPSAAPASSGVSIGYTNYSTPFTISLQGGIMAFFSASGAQITNAQFSGKRVSGTATYFSIPT